MIKVSKFHNLNDKLSDQNKMKKNLRNQIM